MTDDQSRLRSIDVAIELVRAAYREALDHFEIPDDTTWEKVLAELALFATAQTMIAAAWLGSTPEAEFDDYRSRAADLLGQAAPVISLLRKGG